MIQRICNFYRGANFVNVVPFNIFIMDVFFDNSIDGSYSIVSCFQNIMIIRDQWFSHLEKYWKSRFDILYSK